VIFSILCGPVGDPTALTFNRRDFVRLSLCSSVFGSSVLAMAPQLVAQGVAAHTVKPLTRPAPSGRPFYAHFVDVAASAGLQAPMVYGGVESKKYILEACSCSNQLNQLVGPKMACLTESSQAQPRWA
jgi:hypothetical protein